MAGGTGGHVFPAMAIARELMDRGHTVHWMGTRGRIEERVVPAAGIDISYVDVKGIRRNGIMSLIKAPFMVMNAIGQAKKIINSFKPDVVIGFGGYASAPGGMAARLSGTPLILHEQNAAAGMTNRVLARFADRILLGVGEAFTGPKVESVGNPVRSEIMALAGKERSFAHEDGRTRILIVGGSLGATALNEQVPQALRLFGRDDISVFHQCGKDQAVKTAANYEGAQFEYQTSDFIEDMASAYSKADLVICRAGASTVSEVSAVGLPAVFVPLPTAVDDHQTKNAQTLVKAGAARLMPQSELNAQALHDIIAQLRDPATLAQMSKAASGAARLDATSRVCQIIEELA